MVYNTEQITELVKLYYESNTLASVTVKPFNQKHMAN